MKDGVKHNPIQYKDRKWRTAWNITLFNIQIESERRHKNPIQYYDKKWRTAWNITLFDIKIKSERRQRNKTLVTGKNEKLKKKGKKKENETRCEAKVKKISIESEEHRDKKSAWWLEESEERQWEKNLYRKWRTPW